MKADTSFSQKIKEGWTKERLITYYALSEREYERIIECLKEIRKESA
jgi:Cys-tRNA synthase (O-phospho-L-seryl-tRNA:Cys-tRNA synthase)